MFGTCRCCMAGFAWSDTLPRGMERPALAGLRWGFEKVILSAAPGLVETAVVTLYKEVLP